MTLAHFIILYHALGTVAAGLATAACIMGILCLPVLLVLVYRQRQISHASRREYTLLNGFMYKCNMSKRITHNS